MRQISSIIFVILVSTSFTFNTFKKEQESFKEKQKNYPRVRKAYNEKEAIVLDSLTQHNIDINKLRIYLRVFKTEEKIELWAKSASDDFYKFIKNYKICSTSGSLGPKRQEGDLQIPEGFYHINRFNPYSNFYLSLGINYPNRSDRILGVKGDLGGNIFIHGSCVTIGCVPITDDKIKELYVFCVEARNSGENKIPVTIFPAELTNSNFADLKTEYSSDSDKLALWNDLKKGFDIFNKTKKRPNIRFLDNGRHRVIK